MSEDLWVNAVAVITIPMNIPIDASEQEKNRVADAIMGEHGLYDWLPTDASAIIFAENVKDGETIKEFE